MNATYINNINVSDEFLKNLPFDLCWISAACEENSDTLTYHFHNHSFFELHYVTNGFMTYGFEKYNTRICNGQYIVIAPGVPHKVLKHSDNFDKITLAFDVPSECDIITGLRSVSGKVCNISDSDMLLLNHIIDISKRYSTHRNEKTSLLLLNLIFSFFEVAGCTPSFTPQAQSHDTRVIKAKRLIEDNHSIFFTCEDVARHCHISVKQLGRLFKKHEDMGLLEFIHNNKIHNATKLLTETDMSHKHIAYQLGFSNEHYFSKFVLRMTGMTPSQIRTKNRHS